MGIVLFASPNGFPNDDDNDEQTVTRPEHPCPNHNNDHVPRAYSLEHACTNHSNVFQEHTVTGNMGT